MVSFKSDHGKYVVAEDSGHINANRGSIGTWETFILGDSSGDMNVPDTDAPADLNATHHLGLFGGTGGSIFDDLDVMPQGAEVYSIGFCAGGRLDKVLVTWKGGKKVTHGGDGGTKYELILNTDEHVTRAKFCRGKHNGGVRLFYGELTTNQGRSIAGGTHSGDGISCNTYNVPEGHRVVGFYGNSGSEVDRAGVISMPIDAELVGDSVTRAEFQARQDQHRDLVLSKIDFSGETFALDLSEASFTAINAAHMDQYAPISSLFDGKDDLAPTFHVVRQTTMEDWGFSFDLGQSNTISSVTLEGRDGSCCYKRINNIEVRLYEDGSHVYSSAPILGAVYGANTVAIPNVVADEIRFIVPNGGDTGVDDKINFTELSVTANNPAINLNALPILVKASMDIPEAAFADDLAELPHKETADFALTKWLRVLNYTSGYDDQILPVLAELPYWINKGDETRVYWSENHMIMWMSAAWLLHEREGWAMDDNLRIRLVHWLNLKKTYGFYEFFSQTYLPYTLGGVLNLADFAEDEEIKRLAGEVANYLVEHIMMGTNAKGNMFVVAGRTKDSKYTSHSHNHDAAINLLTGMGSVPSNVTASTAELSTTEVDLSWGIDTYTDSLNVEYSFGHALSDSDTVHATQSKTDKFVFQWSGGAYFHPDVVNDTTWMMDTYNLWGHGNFTELGGFSGFPNWIVGWGADIAAPISRSSVITGGNIDIWKHKTSMLSSVHDYRGGYLGYQQQTIMATTGNVTTFTQSGSGTSSNLNSHLPKVIQRDNVAMVIYNPLGELCTLFQYCDQDVYLYWPEDKFDEVDYDVHSDNKWITAREGDSYVAVRRDCGGDITGEFNFKCGDDKQMWGFVVGHADTHGSYANFKSIISQATYSASDVFNWSKLANEWTTKLSVDGQSWSNKW
jgi:hypothetical protein